MFMASGDDASASTARTDSTQFATHELIAIVNEAKTCHIPVAAHAYTSRAIERTIAAGASSIEHGSLMDKHSAQCIKQANVYLVPTLIKPSSAFQCLADGGEGVDLATPTQLDKVGKELQAGIESVKLAKRFGIKMAYGSDLCGDMHDRQKDGFAILTKQFGLSPLEAIQHATVNAAELFNLSDTTGQVKEEFFADIIVLKVKYFEIDAIHLF